MDGERDGRLGGIDADALYGSYYFATGCGRPYERGEYWLDFFGKIAGRIRDDLGPKTVLDAGCAMGFLVEGLRDRGVEASGIDLSPFAIDRVRDDLRPHFRVASVVDDLADRYDLIVCIEVLEHLQAREAEEAVANFCRHADTVLFSSTPIDFREATHVNVRPPEYWAELFARHGFYRDVDFDGAFITDWAALYRKQAAPIARTIAGYERKLWHLTQEVQGSRGLTIEQRTQLEEQQRAIRAATELAEAAEDWARAEAARISAEADRRVTAAEDWARAQAEAAAARREAIEAEARAQSVAVEAREAALLVEAREQAERAEGERQAAAAEVGASREAAGEAMRRASLLGSRLARAEATEAAQAEAVQAARSRADAQAREASDLAARLAIRESELVALAAGFDEFRSGGSARLVAAVSRIRRRLAPDGTGRRHALQLGLQAGRVLQNEGPGAFGRKAIRRLRGRGPVPPTVSPSLSCETQLFAHITAAQPDEYAAWIAANEPDAAALERQRAEAERLPIRPLLSLVTPIYNTPPAILDAMIASVAAQSYTHWELCLADGGSTDPDTHRMLDAWAARDGRVRVERLGENRGISGNSNAALAMARGDFIALLDHDDLLPPFALFEVAQAIARRPDADFLYSDKDLITEDGARRFNPLFKPAWSPEIMLTANYLTHLCVIRTDLAREVGGFRPETDGAQDWDFFLRVVERTDRVVHIPKVLYHWRLWSKSTASGMEAKPYAQEAQRRTLQEHMDRVGHPGTIAFDECGFLRIRPAVGPRPSVSVIVTTSGTTGRLPALLAAVFGEGEGDGEGRPAEVVVVHCGPKRPPLRDYYEDLARDGRVCVLDFDGEPDTTAARDIGARAATGDLLLFWSEDLEPIDGGWLDELVALAVRPGVGVVGAKVLGPDGAIESAGLTIGLDGLAGPIFRGVPEWHNAPNGHTSWYRNWSAVAGDGLMIRRDLYQALGGLDAGFTRLGADVDLCLRAIGRGARVAWTPFSRLRRVTPPPTLAGVPIDEVDRLHRRCLPALAAGDPFFSPNLSLDSLAPAIGPAAAASDRPSRARKRTLERLRADRERASAQVPRPPRPADPYGDEARGLAGWLNFSAADVELSRLVHRTHAGPLEIRAINWFIPGFHNVYYGGIYTILRFADAFRRDSGVINRFYVVGGEPEAVRAQILRAFPNLGDAPIRGLRGDPDLAQVETADVSICTLWTTAYSALKFNRVKRKFYFLQDYEPLFYPAGSISAQVKATYHFGFYGIANTVALGRIYEQEHGGIARHFTPCVDTEIFHPGPDPSEQPRAAGVPKRLFFYGRPGNPRNGFELGGAALRRLKQRLGDRVEILAAGADWDPADYDLGGVVRNLGMLRFEETGALYRSIDAGFVLMFTRHPSYLPFEFMASGALVVTNRNPDTTWLLDDGENCLLAEPSVDCLADVLERGLTDDALRARVTANALDLVQSGHADWSGQIGRIWRYMADPEADRSAGVRRFPGADDHDARASA